MKYKTKDVKLTVDDFHTKNHSQIVADFLKIKKAFVPMPTGQRRKISVYKPPITTYNHMSFP